VRDFVRKVHDAGVLAGVASHCPDYIKRMAEEGWENDLFMPGFYHISGRGRSSCGSSVAGRLSSMPSGSMSMRHCSITAGGAPRHLGLRIFFESSLEIAICSYLLRR